MDVVNERTRYVLPLTFRDEDGTPVTPVGVTVRIDDVASGTAIRAATAINPVSSTHDLEITAEENRIINAANRIELRRVTVHIQGEATGEYLYHVKNLAGI